MQIDEQGKCEQRDRKVSERIMYIRKRRIKIAN